MSNPESDSEKLEQDGVPPESEADSDSAAESETETDSDSSSTSAAESGSASAAEGGSAGDDASKTPGQRIAAQRAAKAAKKAAERARRAEDAAVKTADDEAAAVASLEQPTGPDEIELRAAEAARIMERSTPYVGRIALGALALGVVLGAVLYVMHRRDVAAGGLLAKALVAASAEVGPAPEVDDGRLRFATEQARTAETMRRYRKVISEYASSDAAVRARVALVVAQLDEGKFTEALTELRALREEVGSDDPEFEAQLLELTVIARFGLEKYTEAQADIDRLGRLDRGRYRLLADYLTARSLFERDKRDEAKTKLRAVLEAFEAEGAPQLDHVEGQSQALMRQIDPSALPRSAPAGLGGLQGLEGISPEILRQLQQQLGGQQ